MIQAQIGHDVLLPLAEKWGGGLDEDRWHFHPEGYSIDLIQRSDTQLVAAFDARTKTYEPSQTRIGWAHKFLEREGLSALHIKPDESCWYRKPELVACLTDLARAGVFASFQNVMTYGGSMGGFGALSYAKTLGANRVLAMNPQANLGPDVRGWEQRYPEALTQSWAGPLCDLSAQTDNVETLVLCYDPYMQVDRKQIDLIGADHAIHLRLPFVGHRIPAHLKDLNLLRPLFRNALSGTVDERAFYTAARDRRKLLRYKRIMTEKASGSATRLAHLSALLPADDDLIGDSIRTERMANRSDVEG